MPKKRTRKIEDIVQKYAAQLARTQKDLSLEILKRQYIEKKLRKNEKALAKARQIAKMGHWWWNIAENRMEWSKEAIALLGFEDHNPKFSHDTYINSVHPADRDLVINSARKALANQTQYSIDYRILPPGGAERIIRDEAEPVYDEQGRLAAIL